MAKFCIYCGKPLEEGKSCDCPQSQAAAQAPQQQATSQQPYQPYQTQANPEVEAISSAFASLTKLLTNPSQALAGFVKSVNFIAAIILIFVQAVTTALYTLITLRDVSSIISVPKLLFLPLIFSIVLSAVLYGALYLMIVIFKGKTDPKTLLCAVAIRSVIIIPFTVLGVIFGFASITLGVGLFFVSEIFAFSYLCQSVKVACNVPENKLVLALPIAALIVVIVFALIIKGVGQSLIAEAIGGLFGSGLSGLGGLGGLSGLY